MAKQGIQDFRIASIEEIGRTENLRVIRNLSGSLNQMVFNCNLTRADLNEILEQGVKKIQKLLGYSASSFTPLQKIKESSAMSYFEKIASGYKGLSSREIAIMKLDKQRSDLGEKMSKCREKGRYDKLKEYEMQLFSLNYPFENIEKMNSIVEELDNRLKERNLDIDDYVASKKEYSKLIKLSNEALKTLNIIKVTDSMDFLEKMQEDVRHFLCYLFFERDGKMSDSPNRYLVGYYGEARVDFEHVLLLYNYLKTINYEKINEVEGVLYYYALEQLTRDILPFMGKEIQGIYLKETPTDFTSKKFESYGKGYIPNYLLPSNYRGYLLEPKNINQQSFIAAMNRSDLSINGMVERYKKAQEKVKNKKDGLFYTFLDKNLEEKLLSKLITSEFPLTEMNGEYKDILLNEFEERRQTFSGSESYDVMTNMYNRVVKPYCLEVMGSYIRTYCDKLSLLKDKNMIYIYYISPTRIAIAVRDDVTDDMLKEVFDDKFISILKKIERPSLKDIVFGYYL